MFFVCLFVCLLLLFCMLLVLFGFVVLGLFWFGLDWGFSCCFYCPLVRHSDGLPIALKICEDRKRFGLTQRKQVILDLL